MILSQRCQFVFRNAFLLMKQQIIIPPGAIQTSKNCYRRLKTSVPAIFFISVTLYGRNQSQIIEDL